MLENLEQNIFKILTIRTVTLADVHGKLSPILLLSLVGQFSKFGLSKFLGDFSCFKIRFVKVPNLFFLVHSRLCLFEASIFKATSGLRNGVPPLFSFSNVLNLRSSVEINENSAEYWVYEFEGEVIRRGRPQVVTFFAQTSGAPHSCARTLKRIMCTHQAQQRRGTRDLKAAASTQKPFIAQR